MTKAKTKLACSAMTVCVKDSNARPLAQFSIQIHILKECLAALSTTSAQAGNLCKQHVV